MRPPRIAWPSVVLLLVAAGLLIVPSMATAGRAGPPHLAPLGLPARPHAVPGEVPTTRAIAPGVAARILGSLRADRLPAGVAYLPNLNGRESVRDGVVAPLFTTGPAPVGVAALGVNNSTGTPSPYTLTTSSFEGTLALQNLSDYYLDNGAPDFLGAQLNAVLTNVTLFGDSNFTFWTQNVVRYSDRSHLLEFVDNIWNFSDPTLALSPNAFYATGPTGVQVGTEFYYALGPVINISLPFAVALYLNTSRVAINGSFFDQVAFNYSVTNATGAVAAGSYDRVIFNSQNLSNPTYLAAATFEVNGSAPTPTGYLPYDAEMVLGGPGGGSTTSIEAINGTIALDDLVASGRYRTTPTAIDFGSDTGETAEGVAEYYDHNREVHLGPGPTFFEPFWNASPTAQPGHLTIMGQVTPSPAFAFVAPSHRFTNTTAAWAPINLTGGIAYALPSGPYEVELLLSNYTPQFFLIFGAQPASWWVNATLVTNGSVGLSTPFVARSDAQLAALAAGGAGTPASPYRFPSFANGSVSPLFAVLNDFGYPEFPGLLLQDTRAALRVVDPPSYAIHYQPASLAIAQQIGVPGTNDLQLQLDNVSNVSIWDAGAVSGWFSPYLDGLPEANLMVWNSSDVLVGNSTFASEGASVLLYGGFRDVVWGDRFLLGSAIPNVYNASDVLGLEVYESGDRVFNNLFNVTVPALSPARSPYTETFNGSGSASYRDRWNISARPATQGMVVDGYNLSGSIVGGTTQGGNAWSNYGDAANPLARLPYANGGAIAWEGDYLPLYGPAQGGSVNGSIVVTETGLPASTAWNLSVNGVAYVVSGTSWNLTEPSGRYPFAIGDLPGFAPTPASGVVALDGGIVEVNVSFADLRIPHWPVTFQVEGFAGAVAVTLNGSRSVGVGVINFSLANGSYPYTVDAILGYAGPAGGVVAVAGGANVELNFTPRPGLLNGSITPATASLWVDGRLATVDAGTFAVPVAVGGITLEATAPGYSAGFWNASVGPGAVISVQLSLTALPPPPAPTYRVDFLDVGLPNGTRWGVQVVDGPELQGSSAIGYPFRNGTYAFAVSAPGNYELLGPTGAASAFTVTGAPITVPVTFGAWNGTLALSTDPPNATIYLAGQLLRSSGGVVSVPEYPGTYSVRVSAPGWIEGEENATVVANRTTNLSISLLPQPGGPMQHPTPPPAPAPYPILPLAIAVGLIALIGAFGATWYVRGRRRDGGTTRGSRRRAAAGGRSPSDAVRRAAGRHGSTGPRPPGRSRSTRAAG